MAGNTRIDYLIDFSIQLIRRHKISKAIGLLKKVLEAEPRNLQAMNLLADCLLIVGQFSGAADIWRKTLKYDRYNHHALHKLNQLNSPTFQYWRKRYNKAVNLIAHRQYDKAKDILHGLLLEYDRIVIVYELLGLCYWEDSQESMALGIWEKGLQIDHSYAAINKYINRCYSFCKNKLDAEDPLASE